MRMIFAALLVGFSQQAALAQYPTKPVHIVVPYPPGGAVDAFARADIIKKINQDVTEVISEPTFADKYLAAQGLESIVGSPEQFATLIRAETVKWGKVVKDAEIKIAR